MRHLSSRLTVLIKFTAPIIIFGITLTVALPLLAKSVLFESTYIVFLLTPVLFILSSAFIFIIYTSCIILKIVILNENTLIISNFRRKIIIPLANVKSVNSSVFVYPSLITIHFHKPTVFGSKIVFMAKSQLFPGWGPHPTILELNSLIIPPSELS